MASSSRITDLEKGYANTVLEDEEKSELVIKVDIEAPINALNLRWCMRAINQSEEKWLRYSVLKAEIGVAKTALDGMAVDRPFTKAEPLNKATSTKFTTRKKGEADIGGKIGNEGEKGGRHQSHPLLIRTMVQDSLTNLKELSLRTQKRRHNDINNDEYTVTGFRAYLPNWIKLVQKTPIGRVLDSKLAETNELTSWIPNDEAHWWLKQQLQGP
ncbi:hypothetical protein LguiA_034244 [Lonicera macranthoides]